MRRADWYFDFISPYAYFGLLQLEKIQAEKPGEIEVHYHPILFAELLRQCDQKGPAEIPAKRAWTYRWCTWLAQDQGVPFRFPAVHPFNPLPYLRLCIAAGNTPDVIKAIYEALWTTGADPNDESLIAELAESLQVDLSQLRDPDVKNSLREETEAAIARGLFGVPSLLINEELFWGADASDFVRAYLADPSIVDSAEMQRVATLPVGATRKSA